jgi:gas vesicle protein
MPDQNLEQLRAEAAQRRQAIATDLELMGDRVSPNRIAERRKAAFRQRIHGVRNTVFGTSDRHRVGAHEASHAFGYPVSTPMPSATPGASDHDGGGGSSLSDRAGNAVEMVKEHTPSSLGEATEGNPFAAAVIGFGVGMLAGTLLPSSPDEQRAARRLQGTLEDAGAQVGRTGKEALEHVKPEAQHAVQDLKATATEAVEAVKDEAQSKVDDVKGTAQEKAQDVKGTAQDAAQEVKSQVQA